MVSHLGVYRTSAVRNVGGFRIGLEGSQDYDLVLRVLDTCEPNQVHHIPRPLYHWRTIKESAARNLNIKPYAIDAATKALSDHLSRRSIDGRVSFLPDLAGYHITYDLPEPLPDLTIIIPSKKLTKDLFKQVDEIIQNTNYQHYKVMIGLAEHVEPNVNEIPQDMKDRVIIHQTDDTQFTNYTQLINQCVSAAPSEFICLLDEALTGFKPGWISSLVGQAAQPGIGTVGPKLINSKNNRIVSNGIVFLPDKAPQHLSKGEEKELNGYFGWGKLTRGYSALSNMCLLFKRHHFKSVSGFDESLHDPLYSGIDFCLKLKKLGYRNILRPMVELYIPKNRLSDLTFDVPNELLVQDQRKFEERWKHFLQNDPGFNPNLDIIDEKFLINLDPMKYASRKTL